jgi:hypothetical protein
METQIKGEQTQRPPSYLPNGKRNPDYQRWYKSQNPEKQKEYSKKWNNSERGKAYKLLHDEVKKSQNLTARQGETICLECNMSFSREDARLRGFKFFRGYGGARCICDVCRNSHD